MSERHVLDVRHYPSGRVVFREGDPGTAMYLVVEGRVEIWQGTAENKLVLGYITKGGIFGEMALIDGSPRMASASAADNVQLRVFPLQLFQEKISKVDPFVRALLRVLVQNTRDSNRDIHQMRFQVSNLSAKLEQMETELMQLRAKNR